MSLETADAYRQERAEKQRAQAGELQKELAALAKRTPKGIQQWSAARAHSFKDAMAIANRVAAKTNPGALEVTGALQMLRSFHQE